MELAHIPAEPVAPVTVVDLGDGTKRVTSAEGGYSLVIPAGWSEEPGLAYGQFGQVHLASFDPSSVPPPRPDTGPGFLPPDIGIRLSVEVWLRPSGDPVDAFASRVLVGPNQKGVIGGASVIIGGRAAYRFTIQDEVRFQPASGPLIVTTQQREVWIISMPRTDRMLVMYATPKESALFAIAERAVDTLRLTEARSARLPVTIQRSAVLAQWLNDKSGPIPGRRAAAKLLTYAEAAAAMGYHDGATATATPNGLLRIDHDPDDLFWLVAVSGPGLPEPRGGPYRENPGPSSPPTAWMLLETPATAAGATASTGMWLATTGAWPPGFERWTDRCR